MTNGSRLAGVSASDHVDFDVEVSSGLRKVKRLKNDHPRGFTAEVFLQRPVIDNDFALSGS